MILLSETMSNEVIKHKIVFSLQTLQDISMNLYEKQPAFNTY